MLDFVKFAKGDYEITIAYINRTLNKLEADGFTQGSYFHIFSELQKKSNIF